MVKKNTVTITALLGSIALGAYVHSELGLDLPFLAGPAEATVSAKEPGRPTVSVSQPVSRKLADFDEFTGRFKAVSEVAVKPRVSGQIEAIHFTPGSMVQAGDLLVTIDQRPFRAALREAEAQLAEARANMKLAETELRRQETLAERGHTARATLDVANESAEVARAMIAGATAAVEQARLNLEFTEIHAPISGRISDETVSEGNLVASGVSGPALTTIVSVDPIQFVFDATEAQFLEYQRSAGGGDFRTTSGERKVALRLMDEGTFDHIGHIDFIDNRIDRSSGTIRGRAVFDNPDGLLTPGMFARLRMVAEEELVRLMVPDRAIGSSAAEKFVWVVNAQDTVERRTVAPGALRDGLRVVEGLDRMDRVVVDGLHLVSAGAVVNAKEMIPGAQDVSAK
ncbi:MAG: efflux RND transporter periplasmic adaptor subunit [Roseovarius sp.]